tara:strand:+ start:15090 stop:16298 length:1209 start_codon:yes stop_codon:yes gene_type:complete
VFLFVIFTFLTSAFFGFSITIVTVFALCWSVFYLIGSDFKNSFLNSIASKIYFLFIFFYFPISLIWTNSPNYGSQKLYIFLPLLMISVVLGKVVVNHFVMFQKMYFYMFSYLILLLLIGDIFNTISEIINSSGVGLQRFKLAQDEVNSSVVIGNFFAFSILVLSGFHTLNKNKSLMFINLFMILLAFIFLYYTGARGPLVAMFSSLIIFKLLITKGKRFYWYLIFLILIVIISTSVNLQNISSFLPNAMNSVFEKRYLDESSNASFIERIQHYSTTYNGIFNGSFLQLIFGHGMGDYSNLFLKMDQKLYPHNLLFELAYESGFLFLFLFIYLNIKILIFNIRLNPKSNYRWLFIIYYFLFIRSMFSGDISGNFLVFSFLFFLLYLNTTKYFTENKETFLQVK